MNDILLDDNFGLRIENGDFVIGDAQSQSLKLVMLTQAGEWKHSPLTGAGLQRFALDSVGKAQVSSAIRRALERDGATVKSIVHKNVNGKDKFLIKADYLK